MYVAMNRFRVRQDNAEAFENLWLDRDSHLKEVAGFREFQMLKGPTDSEGVILYASHSVWESYDAFVAWTKSAAFRAAHKDAGKTMPLHEGAPEFEGFTSIQHIA